MVVFSAQGCAIVSCSSHNPPRLSSRRRKPGGGDSGYGGGSSGGGGGVVRVWIRVWGSCVHTPCLHGWLPWLLGNWVLCYLSCKIDVGKER